MKTTQPFISNPNGQIQGKVDLWSGRGYQTYAPPPRGSQRQSSSPPATSPSRPPWCDPTRTRIVGPPWIPWSSVSCPACSAAAPLVSQWTPDWGWRRWLYWQCFSPPSQCNSSCSPPSAPPASCSDQRVCWWLWRLRFGLSFAPLWCLSQSATRKPTLSPGQETI